MTRRVGLLLLLLGLAFSAGCAGVVEFKMPEQYRHMKLKADPPASMLMRRHAGAGLC